MPERPLSLQEQLDKAIAEATAQQWEQADLTLRSVLVAEPSNVTALFLAARVKGAMGELDDATEFLKAIPEDDPKFGIGAMGQRAEYLTQLGRLDEAVSLYKAMISRNESLDVARSLMAIALYRQGKRIEAGWQLNELATRGTASEDELRRLLNITQPPPSREELTRDQSKQQFEIQGDVSRVGGSVEASLSQVWKLLKERRTREASEMLEIIVQEAPTLQAKSLLVYTKSELQEFQPVVGSLASMNSFEKFPSYWVAVGNLLVHLDQDENAASAFLKALSLDSTDAGIHEKLVAVLLRMGNLDAARDIDERRFELSVPADVVVAVGRGQPDDAAAGKDLIESLEKLGFPTQAACWLRYVGPRHPDIFGGADERERRVSELVNTPAESYLAKRLGNIAVTDFPDPASSHRLAVSLTKAWGKSDDSFVREDVDSEQEVVIQFEDATAGYKLDHRYVNLPKPRQRLMRLFESLGTGAVAVDFDRDGNVDFYLGQAAGDPTPDPGTTKLKQNGELPNQLLRQVDQELVDVTRVSGADDRGYTIGLTYGDWNQDGWSDIVVGNFGQNHLLLNQGDGTFRDATEESGFDSATFTSSLAMADVDGDGNTDIVEVNYADDPRVFNELELTPEGTAREYPGPNRFRSGIDFVFLGVGDGTMKKRELIGNDVGQADSTSVDPEARGNNGIPSHADLPKIGDAAFPGLGVVVSQFDDEPGLEIFVANDARPNQFWHAVRSETSGNVRWVDRASVMGLATSFQGKTTACMGVASADFNRDAKRDLVVTNWFDEWVNFYLQNKSGSFKDYAPSFGLDRLSDHHLGFGIQANDLDNDGWSDLVIVNGHIDDYSHLNLPQRMPTQVLRNHQREFRESTPQGIGDSASPSYWSQPHVGRCVINADADRDGRLDVLITDLFDQTVLMLNRTETNNRFVQFEIVATQSERSGVGTKIEILDAQPPLVQVLSGSDGYLGRNESLLHFGLAGASGKTVDVAISWPSGATEVRRGIQVDQRHLIIENEPSSE